MASLVDSRPSPTSIPLPQSQPPPIKTTTNTVSPVPQLQPQAAGTPSPYLDIPGAFPHDKSRPSPGQNPSEPSRGQDSQLRTSFLIRERCFVTQPDCQ